MKKKEIFICDNCGEEFKDLEKCIDHEKTCNNRRIKFRQNVQLATQRALNKYGSIIIKSEYKVDEEIESWCGDYNFQINLELSNGNKVSIYDGFDYELWLGNYLEEDVIYASLEKAIEKRIPTSYEGIIHADWELTEGWRTDVLDGIHISDIVDRLEGRRVKIEVIQ